MKTGIIRKIKDKFTGVPSFTEREIRIEHGKNSLEFKTLSDKVARHSFYNINYHCDFLKESFPRKFDLWTVDKMYPYAKDSSNKASPLYVDTPRYSYNYEESLQKQEIFRKLGLRFIILYEKTTFEDAMTQLGEF